MWQFLVHRARKTEAPENMQIDESSLPELTDESTDLTASRSFIEPDSSSVCNRIDREIKFTKN
jgi:hypothetical protein